MDTERTNQIRMREPSLDKIRGCILGGAAGDALGYAVEFQTENQIFSRHGAKGIMEYELDHRSGKAIISDDTQMTLFTASGLLTCAAEDSMRGTQSTPRAYVAAAYLDWLTTQETSYEKSRKLLEGSSHSWLMDVPELFSRRAPGITCMTALEAQRRSVASVDDFIKHRRNSSKGCGGVMRVAPMAFWCGAGSIEDLDKEAAQAAAVTHGHSLGYMPAAVLAHMIARIVFDEEYTGLKEIVEDARDTVARMFCNDKHLDELMDLIDMAIELSENNDDDLTNIHRLGEGWVGEEALVIAVYCALRYQDDFSAGIIASVNHKGDSDSTGAIAGNILGALLGYEAIEEKWKKDLEISGVIIEIADDLWRGCRLDELSLKDDPDWLRKYSV